ncbi:MAG: hypothetical protein AAGA99_26515 [Actinomycetota bacterium]
MSRYVYVASSWRCETQPIVVEALLLAGVACYDFRNPPGGTGFGWREVKGSEHIPDGETVEDYLRMIEHPRAIEGYEADFAAMCAADTFALVLPCGRSAHLELGWAVGQGKRTAILLEDPLEPELMYRMVDFMTSDIDELVEWAGR